MTRSNGALAATTSPTASAGISCPMNVGCPHRMHSRDYSPAKQIGQTALTESAAPQPHIGGCS